MVNYQEGKIYAIRSSQTDKIYIGSTCSDINKRFFEHKYISKTCKAQEILIFNDAFIDIIENYPCNDRKELLKREGHHILQFIDVCVNKKVEGRTRKETQKAYYDSNKEKLKEYSKNYRNNLKDKKNNIVI
jgi:hypothetical protein